MMVAVASGPSRGWISFSAKWDWFVLWGAKYQTAIKHVVVNSDHLFCLLFSKKPANVIAKVVKEAL